MMIKQDTSDDDDPNARIPALFNRVLHFSSRRVEHPNDAHQCEVRFIGNKLGRVVQIHLLFWHRDVRNCQRETPQRVSSRPVPICFCFCRKCTNTNV